MGWCFPRRPSESTAAGWEGGYPCPGMRRYLPALVLLVFFALQPHTGRAGPEEEFDAADHRRLFTVGDTNAARDKIQEARMALASGQVLRGLHAAQKVLDDMEDDFFLRKDVSTIESTLWQSAAEVVREILAGLTDEQRELYEKLAQPSAAPLLAGSLRSRDESGLREVLLRFGASSTGVRAARVLADLSLEAGRTRDAARYVQEGLRYAPRDAGLWQRLIDAHAAGGDRASLAALTPPPDLSVRVGDSVVSLVEHQRTVLAGIPEPHGHAGWPMWGGVPARNAQLPEQTPMPNRVRWKERTDWQTRIMDLQSRGFGRRPASTDFKGALRNLRPLQPVSDGRSIFVGDGRGVHAYDVYSGREVWQFAGGGKPARDRKRPPLVHPRRKQQGRTSLERAFSPVVAGDLLIATVEVPQIYDPDELQGIQITTYLPRRVLVALDKDTGTLRWWMGQKGVDRLTLAGLSIVSAPAVAEGLVLAIGSYGELIHNVDFLAFDLRTGALRWRRPLGTGQQELNLFGSPLKELAATPVAVSDGVAYASTGLGFIAAVDIRSGVPRWLASYEITPVGKVEYWYAAPVRIPKVAPAPPVVQGDLLIVAPTDGGHLHAYDRRTGRLIWRQAFRTDLIHVDAVNHFLGVANDGRRDIVLLTDHELLARDLVTGEEVWHTRFTPERDRVRGRGAVAGGEVLVPTQHGLQRFTLEGEGAYRGAVPWPEDSQPGNLLPLGRVLVVASRSEIQWFYDWAAIERDVQRRRGLRPDDPTILLEAGMIYLRGGGETERALKAFEEARRIAHAARQPEHEARAVLGLFRTRIMEGDQRAAFPERAIRSYREAMKFARRPREFVLARMRLHRLYREESDAKTRIKNLEALIDEAEDAVAKMDAGGLPLPARAAGLFLLTQEHLGRDRPTKAVDALQRILKEERGARFPEGLAGDLARRGITDILSRHGSLPYRLHERRARELLNKAVSSGDATLLDQLLAEYPNASVVTDALLERAHRVAADGLPLAAAAHLRRLLRDAPTDHPLVPLALARLARSYGEAGAWGAADGALDRLARAHARDPFRSEDREFTGSSFAKAERKRTAAARAVSTEGPATAPTRPPVLTAPLKEVHFERVGDEEVALPIELVVGSDAAGTTAAAPLTLMLCADELIAIDLRRATVAWKAATGRCGRAAYTEGMVVAAATRALRGLDAATGEELWYRETGATVKAFAVSRGLVFAYLQDMTDQAGDLRLVALDAFLGTELWSRPLTHANYSGLRAWGERVLLQQVSRGKPTAIVSLGIYDSFDGSQRHRLRLPTYAESRPVVTDGIFCLAGTARRGRERRLIAIDLERGAVKWQKALIGTDAVSAMTADGKKLVVLRTDGTLSTYAARDGTRLHRTRIYVGDGTVARPHGGTGLLVTRDRVTLLPSRGGGRNTPMTVLSYDRRTGKLAWEAPFPADLRTSRLRMFQRDGLLCTMIGFYRDRVQNALIRVVDADDGKVLQEIEPQGLTLERWLPTVVEGYGTLVLIGKTGASIFRGPDAEEDK